MKDFLKLSPAILPNDNLAKIKTNKIFSPKMSKKNGNVIFLRNSGIEIEKAEVAITHEKIIFLTPLGSKDSLIVGNPACSYSCPYFNINNQKCGICQIKIKKAIKIIVDSKSNPPAAVQPMNTGTAPTNEPGTTANGVILFRFV